MKHEEFIERKIKHHTKMIEALKAHKTKVSGKAPNKHIENAYKNLDNYELVLRKKRTKK